MSYGQTVERGNLECETLTLAQNFKSHLCVRPESLLSVELVVCNQHLWNSCLCSCVFAYFNLRLTNDRSICISIYTYIYIHAAVVL